MRATAAEQSLAKRLARPGMMVALAPDGSAGLVDAEEAGRGAADGDAVRGLLARGALAEAGPARYRLSEAGRAMVRRQLIGDGDLAAQHQTREQRVIEDENDRHAVTIDLRESPLAWLRARKGRDGKPMIDDAAFAAGERLRGDFTRGQLMPSVTANWSQLGAAPRGGGRTGGIAELTDAALSARLRVEHAMRALGPELSGTVVDFCCFLKGIDQIERERDWPKRSAKLVLRLGLEALARHYGLGAEAVGPTRAPPRRRAG